MSGLRTRRLPTLLLASLLLALTPGAAGPRDDAHALNDQALAALQGKDAQLAVILLEKARALDPAEPVLAKNLAWALYNRAQQHAAGRRLDAAIADLRRAAELDPAQVGYRVHLGQGLTRRYRLEEAERVLRSAVADDPSSADGWLLLGDVLGLLDELPAAQEAYEQALSSPDPKVVALAQDAVARTARQHAVEQDYRTDQTDHFIIRGPQASSGPLMGVRLTGVLERARAEVATTLGHHPKQKTIVVLYPPEDFRRVTGTHAWVGGLFDRKIRLPIADVERDGALIEASFRHEFTHLVVSEINPACPTLVNEGLAQVMERGRGKGLTQLVEWLDAKGLSREAFPRLAELPETFVQIADADEVHTAYLVSYAFVDELVSRNGMGAATRWVAELSDQPLAEAYEAATGRSLARDEESFRERVKSAR